jgi:hypothetical protein
LEPLVRCLLSAVRALRYFVEDKAHLIAGMERPTAFPERRTSVRVDTEPDIPSFNRYRPKIVVTSVELEAGAAEFGISGEFLFVRYARQMFTKENRSY